MLKSLQIRDFTVFAKANFEFSPGLNVVVGTNGTGKSHVLKLGYAVARAGAKIWSEGEAAQNVRIWQFKLAKRLKDVFQPEILGKLVRRQYKQAHIQAEFVDESTAKISFRFTSSAGNPNL